MSTKTEEKEEFFKQLVDNAFDFFNNSLTNLEHKPKFALIDFYTGIELCLKARLLHEHWSLIVSKDPNIAKFKAGDIQTISLDEAKNRLKNVLSITIGEENDNRKGELDNTFNIFNELRKERNKMVHFYHPITGYQKNEYREGIISNMLKAWHALFNLLNKKDWYGVFKDYKLQIINFENQLLKNNKYLKEKYNSNSVQEKIKEAKQKNLHIENCPVCKYETRVMIEYADFPELLCALPCLLCNDKVSFDRLKLDCPKCNKNTVIDSDQKQCTKCTIEFTEGDILDILQNLKRLKIDSRSDRKTYDYGNECPNCNSYSYNDEKEKNLFCTSCFYYIDKQSISECEYCGEIIFDYDGEATYEYGCGNCTGNLGRKLEKDD